MSKVRTDPNENDNDPNFTTSGRTNELPATNDLSSRFMRGCSLKRLIEQMDEHNIRAAIDRHWAASAAGDQVGEHEIYYDDVVCEYPQSGEIIYGRRNLEALRSHHPDKPSEFTVRRIVGEGSLWVSEYVINYGGKRVFTVSVMEFRDGKVSRETQYFADSFDAPAWRAQWVACAQ